jgi:hypothetical protein
MSIKTENFAKKQKKMQKVQVAHSKQNTDEGSIPIQTMLMSAGGSTPTVFLTPARPASEGQCYQLTQHKIAKLLNSQNGFSSGVLNSPTTEAVVVQPCAKPSDISSISKSPIHID